MNSPKIFSFLFFSLFFFFQLSAQDKITITGTVYDDTGEALPFASVTFPGTGIGTTTDIDGNFILEVEEVPGNILEAGYVGYESQQKLIKPELATQKVTFKLGDGALQLTEVVVKAKKGRYRKKNNPAVDLIRNVIKNKKDNRLESNDFYEHDVYEKVEMDLTNITEKFRNRRVFKKMQFIFDYVDSTKTDEKPYLPIYFQESMGRVYYKKSPSSKTEFRKAQKLTKLDGYLDEETMSNIMDRLYEDVNIYDNNIELLTAQFVSPLSFFAPDFYAFYINDTLAYQGKPVINLSFIPRNKLDLGFVGNMYVAIDSSYRVMKVKMGIVDDINLNFVEDIDIEQEFKDVGTDGEEQWIVHKNNVVIEYSLSKNGLGFYGRRSVVNDNFVFNQPASDDKYGITEKMVMLDDAKEQDDATWAALRPIELTKTEAGTYHMMDTLQRTPAFRRIVNIISIALTGYTTSRKGPFDIGPINAFYSFNDVEGFRPRFGGRTNGNFSKKYQLEGYLAYGLKDKQFKYQLLGSYSFNDDFEEFPKHYIRLGTERETRFPGQVLRYFSEDNFFLSFRRGTNTRMIMHTAYTGEYYFENKRNLAFTFTAESRKREPYGSLKFYYQGANDGLDSLSEIQTSQLGLSVKWSPNAQYVNGKRFRIAMYNKYPIMTFTYRGGFKGVLGGDYNYHRLDFKIFKRFYLSVLGYSNFEFEAGKIFGSGLPYVINHLPRANQTFAYQIFAFNLMNNLEFSSDEYLTWNYEHYFNGFFFNKIPLLRKLKLREILAVKGLWGRLTDKNNPNLNPELVQFDKDDDTGLSRTYTLENKPYIEMSVGISNIFKFLRIDLVRRMTYLDHPDVPEMFGVKGLAIRGRLKVEF